MDESSTSQESVSTPSVLLNRKGLFGNSASSLQNSFVKEPTPEQKSEEVVNDSSGNSSTARNVESVENGDNPLTVNEKTGNGDFESTAEEEKEDKTNEEVKDTAGEEIISPKIVSMDTTNQESSSSEKKQSLDEIPEDEQVDDEEEIEDEEEEAPRKKVKRTRTKSEEREESEENNEDIEMIEAEDQTVHDDQPDAENTHEVDESKDGEKESNNEQMEEETNDKEEELIEESPRRRTKRGVGTPLNNPPDSKRDRRSNVSEANDPETPSSQESEEPKRGRGRGRKSAATIENEKKEGLMSFNKTPRRGRSKKTDIEKEENVEEIQYGEEEEEEPEKQDEEPRSSRRGRGRKSASAGTPKTPGVDRRSKIDHVEEDKESVNAVKTGRRGRPARKTVIENDDESEKNEVEDVQEDESPRSRRSQASSNKANVVWNYIYIVDVARLWKFYVNTTVIAIWHLVIVSQARDVDNIFLLPVEGERLQKVRMIQKNQMKLLSGRSAKATLATSDKTPAYKKLLNDGEHDPYDLDTEMDKHPEPLKNIHMEVQQFGAVKYAKIGGSSSASRYEFTERAAGARIPNLSSSPQRRERKTLAEMAPGKEKIPHKKDTGILPTPRKGRGKNTAEEEDDQFDMKDDAEEGEKSSQRGRKRKSELETTPLVAPKKATVEIPELSNEEQWKVDHPDDEHEPHAPGARVFALFGKIYYPAVIGAERDSYGRYKVQFTADKIVKDVPAAGIIPLRAVVAGKQCSYNEDILSVIRCPNAASADDWSTGMFQLEYLNEEEDPTGETALVKWTDISLDMHEWKDYIQKKSFEASSIASENITTPAQLSRQARKAVKTPAASSPKPKPKFPKPEPIVRQFSTQLTMNPKGVGKNIFAGMVFMITSAKSTTGGGPVAIRKKHLQEFIVENGGVVTENCEDIDKPAKEILVISDMHYRTHKYLRALAQNMPCISNEWIVQCSEKGMCIDYKPFILPSGVSIIDDKLYPPPENADKLLAGEVFYVHSTHDGKNMNRDGTSSSFHEIWKPMILSLGASIIDVGYEKIRGNQFNYLLTDSSAKEDVVNYAKEIGAKIISSEWVIQTLIMGKKLPVDAHPKFTPCL
ncbi:unnamed protein product [Caenorhabditis bovis]|uniref:BRCT domain-containing protein n=1 Tax=Caenorhabditis bovis TaxID=2654633 RepID=A0A8S1FFU7_9PELO|nr:unnamed protein product [Caenorhabditis bovis]